MSMPKMKKNSPKRRKKQTIRHLGKVGSQSRKVRLYGRLSSRCDVRQWKELFQDDIYVSLDTNEDERQKKLLIFSDESILIIPDTQ